jgi:hypothetical protein
MKHCIIIQFGLLMKPYIMAEYVKPYITASMVIGLLGEILLLLSPELTSRPISDNNPTRNWLLAQTGLTH